MTTKEKILEMLEIAGANFVSGADIAYELGVTRSAVCKNIQQLSESGIPIESHRHQGYRFKDSRTVLTTFGIRRCGIALPPEVHQVLDSTNRLARQYGAEGKKDCVIVAASQTAGRGRLGRTFYSPENTGLYLSLLLHPHCAIENATYITTAAAVAVCRAIRTLLPECEPQIKWVNDIYLNGRKVCGILTEAQIDMENQSMEYAVLGIGVNLLPPKDGFPEDIKDRAGAVFERENLPFNAGNRLTAAIVNEFMKLYHNGNIVKTEFLDEYRRRDFLTGRTVTVLRGKETYEAQVVGIDDNLCLCVKKDSTVIALGSGEVSLKL